LPVTDGFLYVESIYIQANEARMPQVKKVVLAMGDRLIYRDTFQEALAELTGSPAVAQPAVSAVTSNSAAAPAATKEDLSTLTERISRLRKQAEQLTRELETLENETRKK
jgi:uncharacterized membrane protein (UPF0182 family)